MLRFTRILVACLTAFVATTPLFAQPLEDVVYLKDGTIVRGIIIEQIPGESLKIQTQGGSVFLYTLDEIAKIVKEPVLEPEVKAEPDPKPEDPPTRPRNLCWRCKGRLGSRRKSLGWLSPYRL